LVATDFLTIEVCTIGGLVTRYALFFMDIVNRAVRIAGITPHLDSRWMTQIARNLTDLNDGLLRGKRYLILDQMPNTRTHSAASSCAKAFKSFSCRHGHPI
jgi:putative transposase